MTPVPLRVVVVAVSAVGSRYVTELADRTEMIDAIGSKRDGPVEAAAWKRLFARGVFRVATALAVVWPLAGVVEVLASVV